MLTFFRKIRKSLIDSSSARKYLLYAIGEIALVVIGILIALQINNWNEERKKRNMGVLYTLQMYHDIQGDLISLEQINEDLKSQYNAALLVMAVFESEDHFITDSMAFWSAVIECARSFIPKRLPNLWDELKSTGQLSLINNDSLTNLLQEFYAYYDSRIANYNRLPESLKQDLRKHQSSFYKVSDFKKSTTPDYSFIYELGIVGSENVFRSYLDDLSAQILHSAIATSAIWNIQFFGELSHQAQHISSYMEETYSDILDLE